MDESATSAMLVDAASTLQAFSRIVEWADELHLAYAWASSGHGKAQHWSVLPIKKIARAVIGIHFAQTEPYVLDVFAQSPEILKVIDDTEGVFHPKVVLGIKGRAAQAIVGSSNLTVGGFSGNTELNVHLQGSVNSSPLKDVLAFIDTVWTSARAFHPDVAWLEQYAATYRKRPRPPRVPQKSGRVFVAQSVGDLAVDWAAYYAFIAQQERRTLANGFQLHVFDHPEGSYLQEAERCQQAFAAYPGFETMPLELRKLVAGWGGGTTGYFGRMGGAGYFKQRVATQPHTIAQILDLVPLSGTVPFTDVLKYLDAMLALQGISLGTATRLLTVKRPDLFLTANNANSERMRKVFGYAPTTPKSYIRLHELIWAFPWFEAAEPDGIDEQRVWQARVALLDVLLYEIPAYQL